MIYLSENASMLKTLYLSNLISKEAIDKAKENNLITEEEYREILKVHRVTN